MQYLFEQYVYLHLVLTSCKGLTEYTVFCTPPEGAICLTCGTHLALGDYGAKPAVYPRKKKKKKRINGVDTESARDTPAPAE